MATKAKLSQQELRKLMKQTQETLQDKKVESPLARYNNLNELICILCNIKIRNELLWTAHVNGRNHKENLNRLKKKKTGEKEAKDGQTSTTAVDAVGKRRLSDGEVPLEKKSKVNNVKDEKDVKPKEKEPTPKTHQPQRGVVINYDEMDVDEQEAEETQENSKSEQKKEGDLPPDFFDNAEEKADAKPADPNAADPKSADPKTSNKTASQSSKKIPEGFFDDPIMDAKVRKVEYKNPFDDEWERFQKAIAEESTVSQALLEENDEESKAERQIDEIDEQIHNWARVEALQQRKEAIKKAEELASANDNEEAGSNDEDDEFLDWRLKGTSQMTH